MNEYYYVLINAGHAAFVKTESFFISQGGLKEKWGRKWKKIKANSIEDAREICLSRFTREDFI